MRYTVYQEVKHIFYYACSSHHNNVILCKHGWLVCAPANRTLTSYSLIAHDRHIIYYKEYIMQHAKLLLGVGLSQGMPQADDDGEHRPGHGK